MARNITEQAVKAFMAGKNFKMKNTEIRNDENEATFYRLHGNLIAYRHRDSGKMWVCDGGFKNNTTKERLNGLPNVSICQKKGIWFLNGEMWDGKFKEIEG